MPRIVAGHGEGPLPMTAVTRQVCECLAKLSFVTFTVEWKGECFYWISAAFQFLYPASALFIPI